MARTRIPKNTDTTENQSQTAEAPTTSTLPVESLETEGVESPTPPAAEIPATETQPSFVEKLMRERQPGIVPDPFGIAGDVEAGVRLFENRRARLMVIKLEKKPAVEVLDRLKDAGFRWNPRDQVWVHPIYEDNARRIRIEAERTYKDVCRMIRQERGLGESTELPF